MLTHRLPYPPDKGERIRAYHWLRSLACEHEVDLLTLAQPPVPDDYRRALQELACNVTIVTHNRLAALLRMAWAMFTGRSLTEAYFRSRRFAKLFTLLLSGGKYDACLLICSSTGAYLLGAPRSKRLIVDLIDVDSVKWQLYAQHRRGLARWIYRRESSKVAQLERDLAEQSAATIMVSQHECDLLNAAIPGARTLAIPNPVQAEIHAAGSVGQRQPADRLVFVGQMDYFPNVDAVRWFGQNVWLQLLDRHPNIRWFIVGRDPVRAVRKLGRLPNVTVTGTVDDVRPYLDDAISIAPLQIGCGVQNKVLEALAAARPVVASPAAARGLDLRGQEELLIAQTPDEWTSALDLLLQDQALAAELGRRGHQAVAERYSPALTAAQMLECMTHEQSDHLPLAEVDRISPQTVA